MPRSSKVARKSTRRLAAIGSQRRDLILLEGCLSEYGLPFVNQSEWYDPGPPLSATNGADHAAPATRRTKAGRHDRG